MMQGGNKEAQGDGTPPRGRTSSSYMTPCPPEASGVLTVQTLEGRWTHPTSAGQRKSPSGPQRLWWMAGSLPAPVTCSLGHPLAVWEDVGDCGGTRGGDSFLMQSPLPAHFLPTEIFRQEGKARTTYLLSMEPTPLEQSPPAPQVRVLSV